MTFIKDLVGNIGVESLNVIQTSPINTKYEGANVEKDIQPTKIKTLKSETNAKKSLNKIKLSSTVEAVTPAAIQYAVSKPQAEDEEEEPLVVEQEEDAVAIKIDNELEQPEYDLLSREPTEYAEETYRLINLKTSSGGAAGAGRQRQANTHAGTTTTSPKQIKNTHNQSKTNKTINHSNHNNNNKKQLPVGLVTKFSGTTTTNDMDGLTLTTVYETSVIGTYISGKYAQVLQSSSQVFQNRKSKPKVRPSAVSGSSTPRVLKTAAPVLPVTTPKAVTAAAPRTGSFKNRKNSNTARSFKNDQAPAQVIQVNAETTVKTTTETGSGFKKITQRW